MKLAESSDTTSYTRYAVDNIDINEETLSGMGTFHATQVAAFRRKVDRELEMNIQVTPKSERRLDLQVPSEQHELNSEISLENKKPEPQMEGTVIEEWYEPDKNKIDESYKKELAWILSRLVQQQPELQKIPGSGLVLTSFCLLTNRRSQSLVVDSHTEMQGNDES